MNRSTACISRRFYELMGEKVTVDQVVGSIPTRATINKRLGGNACMRYSSPPRKRQDKAKSNWDSGSLC